MRTVLWDPSFYFYLKICRWGLREEGTSVPYFVVRILLDQKWTFVRKKYSFSLNSKTSFRSSGDKSFLILKISVTTFCRFLWWMFKELSSIVVLYIEVMRIISSLFFFFFFLRKRFREHKNTTHLEVYVRVKNCCLCCLMLAYFCFVSWFLLVACFCAR